jgi:hypothetical protein
MAFQSAASSLIQRWNRDDAADACRWPNGIAAFVVVSRKEELAIRFDFLIFLHIVAAY